MKSIVTQASIVAISICAVIVTVGTPLGNLLVDTNNLSRCDFLQTDSGSVIGTREPTDFVLLLGTSGIMGTQGIAALQTATNDFSSVLDLSVDRVAIIS